MKKYFLIIILHFTICIFNLSSGQIPKFQKFYSGDYSNGVGLAETDSGFMLLCNKYGFGTVINDFSLVAVDSSGNFMWYKKFSLLNYALTAKNIFKTADGGFFVLGITDENPSPPTSDIFLLKTDASGNPLWTKIYDTGQDDYAVDGELTIDGGMIICGRTNSYTVYVSPFLLKVDSTGNVEWSKVIDFSTEAYGESVEQTTDSGFIFLNTYYLIKTDVNGNVQWLHQIVFTGPFFGCNSHLIKETSDHGFIISGIAYPASSFLYKTDSTGNIIWNKYYYINSGALPNLDFYSISIDQSNNFIMSGLMGDMMTGQDQDMLLMKTDGFGASIWTYSQGTPGEIDVSRFVHPLQDGSYISIGNNDDFASGHNVYLVKTDLNGSSGCNESTFSVNSDTLSYLQTIPSYSVIQGFTASNISFVVGNNLHTETTLCSALNTAEFLFENKIDIFPNPADEEFVIQSSKFKVQKIEIINLLGEVVFSNSFETTSNSIKLQTSNLSSGIYIIKVYSDKEVLQQKLVIQ